MIKGLVHWIIVIVILTLFFFSFKGGKNKKRMKYKYLFIPRKIVAKISLLCFEMIFCSVGGVFIYECYVIKNLIKNTPNTPFVIRGDGGVFLSTMYLYKL